MDSPETELRYSAVEQTGAGRRGPNPNRDYKRHFIRQKERYTAVTTDQVNRKKELSRASLKQLKLQEEIEFIVDAIAGERHRRQQPNTEDGSSTSALIPAQKTTTTTTTSAIVSHVAQDYTPSEEKEEEDVKPVLTETQAAASAAVGAIPPSLSASKKGTVDEDLEGLLDSDEDPASNKAPAPPRKSTGEATGSLKRNRSFSSDDMDDELLESAGVSASKRSRKHWT